MSDTSVGLMLSRRFGPLFAAQFLGAFNDNLLKSALGVLATWRLAERTGIDAGALTMLAGAAFIAPFVLFSGAAGTLADRIDKSRIARWVKIAELALMAVGAIGLAAESLGILLAALFLLGVHSTVFGPVKYAVIPQYLPPDELVAGNALVDAGTFLAILLGTLVGSALVLVPGGALWIGAIGIAASAAGLWAARAMPPAPPAAAAAVPRPRLLADGIAVMTSVAREPGLLGPILVLSWFWAVGGIVVAGLPVLARETLGAREEAVTLMLTLFAVGVGAGSMLANRIMKGAVSPRLVPWAALGMAIAALVVAPGAGDPGTGNAPLGEVLARPAAWRFLGGLAALAVAGGLLAVPLYALLLRRSEPERRARVIAANNIANAIAMVAASLGAAALLGAGWSMPAVIGLCGAATVAVAARSRRAEPSPPRG